ncbi:hypothetical protein [Croceivirga radicis]|uniref:hypothetical protein n=1 Tax=Croceivirga radicis TaxID=1929488 RepID=UPI0012FF1331|nr:hypothetical protein [Croceivirga radicis]
METLVASILIVIIFLLATTILNNLFLNTLNFDKSNVQNRINLLSYKVQHNKLSLPYTEEYDEWLITIKKSEFTSLSEIHYMAKHEHSDTRIEGIVE